MQKPLLIQGAEETEISYLKNILENYEEKEISGYKFYLGKINNYPVILSKTNVGLISSAIATTIASIHFSPIAIINQGTAGGHGKNIHKGDIVICRDYINQTSFKTDKREEGKGSDIKGWNIKKFHTDDKEIKNNLGDENLIKIAKNLEKEYKLGKVHIGRIGSGDIWNREIDRILFLNKEYETLCEDMETASVYSVANDFKIPVIGIRIISNNEILGEEYDPNLAIYSQKYAEKTALKFIELVNEKKEKI